MYVNDIWYTMIWYMIVWRWYGRWSILLASERARREQQTTTYDRILTNPCDNHTILSPIEVIIMCTSYFINALRSFYQYGSMLLSPPNITITLTGYPIRYHMRLLSKSIITSKMVYHYTITLTYWYIWYDSHWLATLLYEKSLVCLIYE